jgi:hypothetical protein
VSLLPNAGDLGLAHEMMSGDTSFEAAYKVAAQHEFAYARAFINQSSCGQRRPMEAGILNDFVAISTYGPYVDAMFVDKECAELLALGRVRKDVSLKAKVFSLRTRDEFLLYLTDLAESATQEVRHSAKEIYGIF